MLTLVGALLLTFGFTPVVRAQAQRWVVPYSVIDFTVAPPTVTPLVSPHVIPLAPPDTAANSVFDSSGKLLFYVINEPSFIPGRPFRPIPQPSSMWIVDAEGQLIDTIPSNDSNHQIAIFSVPGNCDQYLIVYLESFPAGGRFQPPGIALLTSVLDIAKKKIVHKVSDRSSFFSQVPCRRGALAVGRLRNDGSRFLYVVSCLGVAKLVVSPTGSTLDSLDPLLFVHPYSDAGDAIQATLSSDGKELAWSNGDVFVVNLDPVTGSNVGLPRRYSFGPTAGLEFSPDGRLLFLSPATDDPKLRLSYINLTLPVPANTFIEGSEGYGGSLLQLAADHKIYVAGAGDLGAIDSGPSIPSFTRAAVPGIVATPPTDDNKLAARTLPYQINGEAQLTCEDLCGNPALIQSTFGKQGNFEVVVPFPGGGIAHYWRDNDAPDAPWYGPTVFGTNVGTVDAVSMIQSNYGNLEVVARVGDRLAHFWRGGSQWYGSGFFASGVSGTPSWIQGTSGPFPGNFELVTPLAAGGLAHYWRDNDPALFKPWHREEIPSTRDLGIVADVTLIQSTLGVAGNDLEIVARIGDRLAHFSRDFTGKWSQLSFFATGVSGTPSFIQGNYANPGGPGNFEVVAPQVGGGMAHYWRDGGGTWRGPFPFSNGNVRSVSLIQSNYGQNFEVVARRDCSLVHYWRTDATAPSPWTWYGATLIIP
jgi:hypothetical protein